ncbi:MAG TPA: 2Fe-2S iron-sulfur cluster-binding protein [Burkholderiaceae bacterium]|nr:2Fe-2S iron-sulfur cluster-binding protein [Burkholderiaceae bacterium]
MALVTLVSGKSFQAPTGMSILDAASLEKIAIPYSCKTGRCNTCKCKVISGSTRALHLEVGLTENEKAEGWILSCVRSVESDSLLEVSDLGDIELPIAKTLPCRISEIRRLTSNAVQVFLRLPPHTDFRFMPGQYIDVIGPNGVRRSYSLANSSFAEKMLELHIREVQGGVMSDYWFNQAKSNDLLRLNGPLGTFFLRETKGVDLIFLATGTGISPVKAMLESMISVIPDQRPKSVTVLWGGRRPEDLYLNIANISGFHTYIPVLSRPDKNWSGANGYVHDVLMDTDPDLKNAAVYACGSDAMIHSAKTRLVQAGLPAKRFYSDAFLSSEAT